jgi:hypothetical protein
MNWKINEDMAAITADREERERLESESYNDARYMLSRLGFGSRAITDITDAAKHNVAHIRSLPDQPESTVRVTYEATAMMGSSRFGEYKVTVNR